MAKKQPNALVRPESSTNAHTAEQTVPAKRPPNDLIISTRIKTGTPTFHPAEARGWDTEELIGPALAFVVTWVGEDGKPVPTQNQYDGYGIRVQLDGPHYENDFVLVESQGVMRLAYIHGDTLHGKTTWRYVDACTGEPLESAYTIGRIDAEREFLSHRQIRETSHLVKQEELEVIVRGDTQRQREYIDTGYRLALKELDDDDLDCETLNARLDTALSLSKGFHYCRNNFRELDKLWADCATQEERDEQLRTFAAITFRAGELARVARPEETMRHQMDRTLVPPHADLDNDDAGEAADLTRKLDRALSAADLERRPDIPSAGREAEGVIGDLALALEKSRRVAELAKRAGIAVPPTGDCTESEWEAWHQFRYVAGELVRAGAWMAMRELAEAKMFARPIDVK